MIRSMLTLTALAAFVGFDASAQAPVVDTSITAVVPDTVRGTIESIDKDSGSFTLKVGERTQEVKVDKATLYYLDGKESTRGDVLKVGAEVSVTHSSGLASRIDGKA